MKSTGAILAKLRKEKELAQKELALMLNLSVSTISNYENDIHSPDLATLCKLADFYHVTTDYILGRSNFRFDPQTLNRKVLDDYSVFDVLDTILSCERNGYIGHLVSYAEFLRTLHPCP
jgi:transcriptional regulator with XRE-family HTH domain